MTGAVFQFEILKSGRRQRGYFLRWTYAVFLLVQIVPIFFLSQSAWNQLLTGLNLYSLFERFLVQHFVFLTILIPLLTCGAITEEKIRGTLQYLLTANLRPLEIILGKMLAQLYQIGLLTLVGLPLFCFFAGLAGDATFPVTAVVTSLALAFGIAGLGMLLSVWCRSTRDALLCMYLLMGLAFMLLSVFAAAPLGARLATFHPLRVLALDDPAQRWHYLGEFLLGWLSVGMIGLLLASWRLRKAYRRQLQIRRPIRSRWWTGTPGRVRGNPILWREQKVEGIAPVEFLRRFPRWLGMANVMLVSAGALSFLLVDFLPAADNPWAMIREGEWRKLHSALQEVGADALYWQGLATLFVVTLVVGVRSSGAITGEKEKGTWQAILLTPMSTEKIIAGKHWGIFWACVPYLLAHAVVVVPVGLILGFEATAWAVLLIGVMILAIILGGAVGLWCSARAVSSWRSCLTTLAIFYSGWIFFFVPISIILFVLKGILEGILWIIGRFEDTTGALMAVNSASVVPLSICVGLALAFWALTHHLIAAAVARVGQNDRAKEMEFDFHFQSRDYFRGLERQQWETLRGEGAFKLEASVVGQEDEVAAPIPFMK